MDDRTKNVFLDSAKEWICDDYSACISFIAGIYDKDFIIWKASILLSPLPVDTSNDFSILSDQIFIGQITINFAKKEELINLLDNAVGGNIRIHNREIILPEDNDLSYYSIGSHNDSWFHQVNISVVGRWNQYPVYTDSSEIDNSLRLSEPPFDGLHDAASWLGLSNTSIDDRNPSIEIKINSPIDFIINESSLNDDVFDLIVHVHPLFDTKLSRVAVRAVPGEGLNGRLQIASEIKWGEIKDNRRIGAASINVKNSDNILTMLLIGNSIVRRHWFLDPAKARNNRLLAVQNFDKDLTKIKEAVFDAYNSSRFEYGIAALLFLLGFSPSVQLEKESPDLVVQTPGGRLILVECTLKTSDFSAKIGKLVDRRVSLVKELEKSGHSTSVSSVLVCRQQRDQIATHVTELKNHKVILVTWEMLVSAFDRVRYHNDPDQLMQDAESALNDSSQLFLDLQK